MDYNKIKNLADAKNITIKYLAELVQLSEIGLHKMLKNKAMKIDILERVALVLKVPISYFFDENSENSKVLETEAIYKIDKGKVSVKIFDEKDYKIKLLETEVELLKERLINKDNEIENMKKNI